MNFTQSVLLAVILISPFIAASPGGSAWVNFFGIICWLAAFSLNENSHNWDIRVDLFLIIPVSLLGFVVCLFSLTRKFIKSDSLNAPSSNEGNVDKPSK